MEALQQRLSKYKEGEEAAKQEGNSNKIKRMARIVKVSWFILRPCQHDNSQS